MKKKLILLFFLLIPVVFMFFYQKPLLNQKEITAFKKSHWFILHRKSGRELLFYGQMGDANHSRLIKIFQVKPGSHSSPTPLPKLLGRDYWLIIQKENSTDNPETAPYFLTLDIPSNGDWPYGPSPYLECRNPYTNEVVQCDWGFPGYFGLHGINGDISKLSKEDLGSSGCIRHSDEDIKYLYNLLSPETEEIRYYIEDD